MPVNYRLKTSALKKLLGQINGIYIPGDTEYILFNEKYMATIASILDFA